MRVLGIDGLLTRRGWVTVTLEDDALHTIRLARGLNEVLDEEPDAAAYAVNLPLEWDEEEGRDGVRACDAAARTYLGPNAARLDPAPPRDVLAAADLDAAHRLAKEHDWSAPNERLWQARERIKQAQEIAAGDDRFVEAHPELSFTVLLHSLRGEGTHLEYTRVRSVVAQHERLALLHEVGLRPARSMGGIGRASPEDVLAATVLAWTARRVARNEALGFPRHAQHGAARLWA